MTLVRIPRRGVWVSDWDFGRKSFDICHCQWMCHCECECDHGNFKTNQNTSEKKLTVQVSIGNFFLFWHRFKCTPYWQREGYCWERWILNDIEIALCNGHFRYRGSIEYRDTRDGIVIVVPISGIAQHYCASQMPRVVRSCRRRHAVRNHTSLL